MRGDPTVGRASHCRHRRRGRRAPATGESREERRRRGESETRNARRQERNGAKVAGEGRGTRPWLIYAPPNGRIQRSGCRIQWSGEEWGGGGALGCLGLWQAVPLSGRRPGCHRADPYRVVPRADTMGWVAAQELKGRRAGPALRTIYRASGRARVGLFRAVPWAANRARPIWNSIVETTAAEWSKYVSIVK